MMDYIVEQNGMSPFKTESSDVLGKMSYMTLRVTLHNTVPNTRSYIPSLLQRSVNEMNKLKLLSVLAT
jgi:hypothetical protein